MQTFETVPGAAHAELLRWSKVVHVQFDADNLHLTGRWISETERAERGALQSELATLKAAMANLTGVVQTLARAIIHGSGDATGADTSAAGFCRHRRRRARGHDFCPAPDDDGRGTGAASTT